MQGRNSVAEDAHGELRDRSAGHEDAVLVLHVDGNIGYEVVCSAHRPRDVSTVSKLIEFDGYRYGAGAPHDATAAGTLRFGHRD